MTQPNKACTSIAVSGGAAVSKAIEQSSSTLHVSQNKMSDLWTRGVGHFTGVGRVNASSWEVAPCFPLTLAFYRTWRLWEVTMLSAPAEGACLLLSVMLGWWRRWRWRGRRWRRRGWWRRAWSRLRGRRGVMRGGQAEGLGGIRVRLRARSPALAG